MSTSRKRKADKPDLRVVEENEAVALKDVGKAVPRASGRGLGKGFVVLERGQEIDVYLPSDDPADAPKAASASSSSSDSGDRKSIPPPAGKSATAAVVHKWMLGVIVNKPDARQPARVLVKVPGRPPVWIENALDLEVAAGAHSRSDAPSAPAPDPSSAIPSTSTTSAATVASIAALTMTSKSASSSSSNTGVSSMDESESN